MPDLQVICGCTRPNGLLEKYRKQVESAGIGFYVDHIDHMPNNVGNLGMKIASQRKMLDKFSDCKKVVYTDAWDVLFYGDAGSLFNAIPNDAVVLGAERNCWPDLYLTPHFPAQSPWKFFNGGFMAGTPDNILKFYERVEKHPAYVPYCVDQQWFNWMILAGEMADLGARMDYQTRLVYCNIKEQGTLKLNNTDDGLRLYNPLCGSAPLFLHFNGGSGPQHWEFVEKAAEYGIHVGIMDSYTGQPGSRVIHCAVETQEDAKKLRELGIWPTN